MAPQVYAQEAIYQPKYAELQANVQNYLGEQALQQAAKMYPQVAQIEAGYNAANRAAELQQLQSTLPEYQKAFSSITPGYQEALGSAGQLAQQSMARSLQAPQLTAFEAQVGNPYGSPRARATQPPAMQAYQNQQGQVIGQQMQVGTGQQLQDQIAQGRQFTEQKTWQDVEQPAYQSTDPNGPAYFAPRGVVQQPSGQSIQAPQGQMGQPAYQQGAPQGQDMFSDGYLGQFVGGVQGPQMQSGLGQINQGSVQQYLNAMPGAQDYANFLAENSRQELSAGKSLTPEEQRLADQSARSAFAARGTALGGQAVNAEILNRASVGNQRYQQRLANAQSAAGQIQSIYQPALAQSLDRQKAGLQYNLGAQEQAFNQAFNKENLGATAQQTAFNQALARGQAEQGRLQAGTAIQAGQAQLGAGAMGQLQAAQAPVLQAFYKQPILQGAANSAQQMGYNMGQAAGPQLFNPESQTGMGSIYGAYNSQMNLAAAQAQANAAKSAGKSSMMGSLGGGLLAGGGMIGGAMILA